MTNKLTFLLILLLEICIFRFANGKIIGAFILPHGGIALNPSSFQTPDKLAKERAWKIHLAAVDTGRYIRKLRPDLILLSTPHGVADLTRFTFYLNSLGNGSAETDNCKCPPCCYDVSVKLDSTISRNITNYLIDKGLNVSGLSFFGGPGSDEPAILKWGEVIPLLFVRELGASKVVIMSHPSERYSKPVGMIPQLLTLGRNLYEILDSTQQKVVVIVSCDLAHTHQASGPYGFSTSAEPFDKACGNWVTTLHPSYILEVAAQYVEKALSCGYTGLVMLHGMLDAGKLSSWKPLLYANYHPSYYGMMVASFTRNLTNFSN